MIMLSNDGRLSGGFFFCVCTLNDHGVPEVIDDQFYPIDHVGSYFLPLHRARQGVRFDEMYMAIFNKASILKKPKGFINNHSKCCYQYSFIHIKSMISFKVYNVFYLQISVTSCYFASGWESFWLCRLRIKYSPEDMKYQGLCSYICVLTGQSIIVCT